MKIPQRYIFLKRGYAGMDYAQRALPGLCPYDEGKNIEKRGAPSKPCQHLYLRNIIYIFA